MRPHRATLPALVALLALAPAPAQAHSRSVSYSIWRVEGTDVHLYVELEAQDVLESVFIDADRDGVLTGPEAHAGRPRIATLLERTASVADGPDPCEPLTEVAVEVPEPPSRVFLRRTWRCQAAVTELRAALRLHEVVRSSMHRNLANFKLPKEKTAQHVFAGSAPEATVAVEQPPEQVSAWAAFRVYATLGAEHILTGYDHLLFLAVLLIVWPGLRRLLAIITSFTLAHSITLALAALEVVALPPRLVESVIALSIAYVAVENLWTKDPRHRWLVTFIFGLVHGFGFASVLRTLGLPRAHLVTSLLAFNVGVELGQLAAVVPFAAVLWLATRLPRTTRLTLTRASSLAILALALLWFGQRAFAT